MSQIGRVPNRPHAASLHDAKSDACIRDGMRPPSGNGGRVLARKH
jgi:hypothetical protein